VVLELLLGELEGFVDGVAAVDQALLLAQEGIRVAEGVCLAGFYGFGFVEGLVLEVGVFAE
jgi:hypothetical protein